MKTLILSNSIWNIYNFRFKLVKEISKKNNLKVYCDIKKNFNIKKKIKHKINIKNISFSSKSINLIDNFKLIYQINLILKKEKPKKVISFTLKPNLFCGLLSYFYSFKFFPTLSGLGTSYNRGGIFFYLIKLFIKISFKNASKIFIHNKNEKLILQKLGLNKKKIIQVNGSGIDFDRYKKINLSKKFSNNNFLYIGRLLYDKGIIELIEAFKILEKTINCKLTLAVIIDIDNVSSIKLRTIKSKILNSNIYLKINNKNLKQMIKTHDCVVLPSYSEGMSRAIMEAGSFGRPIICSNISGCREMVQNGFNGFLVKPKSIESLLSALKKFSNLSFKDKLKFGSNSRLLLKKKEFDENKVINKYLFEINDSYK